MRNIRELIANREDFIPANSFNPHNVHAHMLSNEFGLFAIVYASQLQEALDVAVDEGFMDSMQIAEEDVENEDYVCRLGNASEAFNIDYLHCAER